MNGQLNASFMVYIDGVWCLDDILYACCALEDPNGQKRDKKTC